MNTVATPGASASHRSVRSRLLVPSLALLTTMTSLVSSLGAPLVPAIASDAQVSLGTAQWTLTATLLMGAVATPLLGRLGGNRRRRAVIIGGLLLVTLGTLLSALPWGFPSLLAGRALQGVGIGLVPLAMAVAREFVHPDRLGGTIAVLSVTTVAGAGLGYPVTAFVAHELGIAAAFWGAFAMCCVCLALTLVAVPSSRSDAEDRVDWWGAVLLATSTAGLLLSVSQGDHWGWASGRVLGLGLGSLVGMWLWVRRSLAVSRPLVDLRLAWRGGALAPNVTGLSAGVAVYMLLSLIMLAVQSPVTSDGYGLGEPVTTAGLLLVPYSITTVLGSRVAILLSRRISLEMTPPIGCTLYLFATVVLALAHHEVWHLVVVMAFSGLGSGCCFAPMPTLIVRACPPEETGSAIAFHHVLRFLGFSAGSALAVALLEVFAENGVSTDRSFTAVVLVAATIWVVTVPLSLILAKIGRRSSGGCTTTTSMPAARSDTTSLSGAHESVITTTTR